MASTAFAAPLGVPGARRWLRKITAALAVAAWAATIATLFAVWLTSQAQRVACDATIRGGRVCAPSPAVPDPDCASLGRGGVICSRGR
jgi:hypothetical protein